MGFDLISYAMGKATGGGGGGGSISWRDSLSCNWDFANPVNTRGQTSYENSGTIATIDGWRLTAGKLQIVSGGIKLSRYTAGTTGYFLQRYNKSITAAFSNKTMICSVIIDGDLGSFQVETTSGSGHKGGTTINGVVVRIYNYGTLEYGVTIDIGEDAEEHLIQAIKLEAGSSQTLATNRGGVWVLNNAMDAETERIKIASGWVYNT